MSTDHNILLALDDSDSAARAVDYVCQHLESYPTATVTLFHVREIPPALLEHGGAEDPREEHEKQNRLDRQLEKWRETAQAEAEQQIFARARTQLVAASADGRRIDVHTMLATDADPDVSRLIMDEARTGRYDTVVLGRGKPDLEHRLIGSTTSKVVDELECCTLWIV